jgi:hypothetical protein
MNHLQKVTFIRQKAEEHVPGSNEKIYWSFHALSKLRTAELRKVFIEASLRNAVLVEDYPDHGRPLPDCLLLGFIGDTPIHIVAAIDVNMDRIFIITLYRPDIKRWENDWKRRKR